MSTICILLQRAADGGFPVVVVSIFGEMLLLEG